MEPAAVLGDGGPDAGGARPRASAARRMPTSITGQLHGKAGRPPPSQEHKGGPTAQHPASKTNQPNAQLHPTEWNHEGSQDRQAPRNDIELGRWRNRMGEGEPNVNPCYANASWRCVAQHPAVRPAGIKPRRA